MLGRRRRRVGKTQRELDSDAGFAGISSCQFYSCIAAASEAPSSRRLGAIVDASSVLGRAKRPEYRKLKLLC